MGYTMKWVASEVPKSSEDLKFKTYGGMRRRILIWVLIFLCGAFVGKMMFYDTITKRLETAVNVGEAMQQEVIQERLAVERLSAQLWLLEKAVE